MEECVCSLAFGHRAIPAQLVDIEDETPDGAAFTNEEARYRGLFHSEQGDPTLINPRSNKGNWQERQAKRVKTGKEAVLQMLGFDEDEDEIVDEDDEEDDGGGHSHTLRGNPFVLSSCAISRKRHHDDSEAE